MPSRMRCLTKRRWILGACAERVALVTGDAGSIGSGICAVIAENGATVIVGYHSHRNEAAALAYCLPNQEAGHSAHAVPVTDSAAMSTLTRGLDEQYGRLDILMMPAAA